MGKEGDGKGLMGFIPLKEVQTERIR